MTKDAIVQAAIDEAIVGTVAEEIRAVIERRYDDYKATLLARYPWDFSLKLTRKVSRTDDGEDLGYEYRYKIQDSAGTFIEPPEVLGVNIGEDTTGEDLFINPKYALTFGYAIDVPDGSEGSSYYGPTEFFYKGGVLYSNREIQDVVYKPRNVEEYFSPDFKLSLTFLLASFIAGSVTHEEVTSNRFNKRHRQYLRQAMILQKKVVPDLDRRIILNWARTFYKNSWHV